MRKFNCDSSRAFQWLMPDLQKLIFCFFLMLTSYPAFSLSDALEDSATFSERAKKGLLLGIAKAGDRLVTVGERGHILYSDDRGEHWQQAHVPVRVTLTSVDFPTPHFGWAVGHDGVILATEDGGTSWHKQLDGYKANLLIEDELKHLLTLSDTERLALGIQYETDELEYLLEDTELFSSEGASRPFLDVSFLDEKNGFAVGAYGMIFRTTDSGENWKPWVAYLNNPDNFHLNALIQGRHELYMAGEAGSIYRSDDQGLTWSNLTSPYDGPFFGLTVSHDSKGQENLVVYGLRGNSFISKDKGEHWTQLDVESDAAILGAVLIKGGNIVLLTSSGELYQFAFNGDSIGRSLTQDQGALSSGIAVTAEELLLVGINGMTYINLPQTQWEAR